MILITIIGISLILYIYIFKVLKDKIESPIILNQQGIEPGLGIQLVNRTEFKINEYTSMFQNELYKDSFMSIPVKNFYLHFKKININTFELENIIEIINKGE